MKGELTRMEGINISKELRKLLKKGDIYVLNEMTGEIYMMIDEKRTPIFRDISALIDISDAITG